MSCDAIRDLLSAFLDGEADASERRLVEEHLSACAACRAELEGLRRTVAGVKGLPKLAAPPELARRIAEALPAATVEGDSSPRPAGSPPAAPGTWAPMPDRRKILTLPRFLVPLGAAAGFILAVATALYVERESHRPNAYTGAPVGDAEDAGAVATARREAGAGTDTGRMERDMKVAGETARKDAAAAPAEFAAARAPEAAKKAAPAKGGREDDLYAEKGGAPPPAASSPAAPPPAPSSPVLAAEPAPAAAPEPVGQGRGAEQFGLAQNAPPAVQAPAPDAAPPPPAEAPVQELAHAPGRDPASDPFRPRQTPKAESTAGASPPPPAGASASAPAAGKAGPPPATLEAEAAADAVESPVVVLALHGGDPVKQAAMLDALAYAPSPADEKRSFDDKNDGARPREKARSLEGLARVREEAVRRAAKEGRPAELVYDLAPEDAARFLRGLAGRRDARVTVERTLIGGREDGEADAPVFAALASLQAREADLELARADALAEAPAKPAERQVQEGQQKESRQQAEAKPAAKASESSAGAGAPAKPAAAAKAPQRAGAQSPAGPPAPSRVRIVVRLKP
jgi:hypothetical protein